MSPIIKVNNFPSIRISDKLRTETEKACELEQENISEYIRKAVEQRNKRILKVRE
jgi:LytS/YehU family sensor histidine kinase